MNQNIDVEEFRQRLSEAREQEVIRYREERDRAVSVSRDEPQDVGDRSVTETTIDDDLHRASGRYERIEEIEDAMNRLDEGTYGECMECGDDIPVARLRLIPEARTCADCAEELAHERQHRQYLNI